MPKRLEDEIKRQIDESGAIDVDSDGFIRKGEKINPHKPPKNPETGEPVTRLKEGRWYSWYRDNRERLLAREERYDEAIPRFYIGGNPEWPGLGTGYLKPRRKKSYRIAIIYPDHFPISPPEVWVIDPIIKSPKHQVYDGHLCFCIRAIAHGKQIRRPLPLRP